MFYICLLDEMAEGYFTNYNSNSWGMILGCCASSFQCRFLDFWEKEPKQGFASDVSGITLFGLNTDLGGY